MNRDPLESELKRAHVQPEWLAPESSSVTFANVAWETISRQLVGENAPTARFDYWICPNRG
jgi:hypothetical protein